MTDRYIQYLRTIRRYSPRTCEIYRGVLDGYFAFADTLDSTQIRNYEVYLMDDRKLDPRTVHLHLSVLSGYCRFLMKEGLLEANPVRLVTRPKVEKRLPVFYREESMKEYLEKTYGREEAAQRIIAITDAKKGALKTLATQEGYRTFVVPDNVGGRYSVLTAVGLLPIAVAGIDTDAMLRGAEDAMNKYTEADIENNPCLRYAAIRNILYRSGKTMEILAAYEPAMQMTCEWWKQLYGESEGKDNKGIFPASVIFSTDLHSLGQYIQQGLRNLFETVIDIEESNDKAYVPDDPENSDGLNFISGMELNEICHKAMTATLYAHYDGGVPNMVIEIPDRSAYTYGELVYFFELACGVSGYTLGVNPFNQPGVEAYKKNMFALLGKPDPALDELKAKLAERMNEN